MATPSGCDAPGPRRRVIGDTVNSQDHAEGWITRRVLNVELLPQAISNSWGVLYMDVSTCFISAGVAGCYNEFAADTVKNKAPVVVGMFNLHGKGRGHAFGAGTGGGRLISRDP